MKITNLNFSGYIVPANSYDNMGAHNTVKFMMQKGEYLTVKFSKDKGGYNYAWVASDKLKGFKYLLTGSSIAWLATYLQSGEYEDCNIKPTEVTPEEDENFDIQTKVLKIFINQKRKVQITPLFRETSGYINATASFAHGKVLFRIKCTEELVDYLREQDYLI